MRARNTVGFSLESEPISILVASPPDAPISLVNVPGKTTAYQVGLNWQDASYDGSSPVIDYRVSYALESDLIWQVFESNVISTYRPFIVTGLTPG